MVLDKSRFIVAEHNGKFFQTTKCEERGHVITCPEKNLPRILNKSEFHDYDNSA